MLQSISINVDEKIIAVNFIDLSSLYSIACLGLSSTTVIMLFQTYSKSDLMKTIYFQEILFLLCDMTFIHQNFLCTVVLQFESPDSLYQK